MLKLSILTLVIVAWAFVCVHNEDNRRYTCTQTCGMLICPNGTKCCCRERCPATCMDPTPSCCAPAICELGCYTICPRNWVFDKYGGKCTPLQCCPNIRFMALARCQAPVNGSTCGGGENEQYVSCGTMVPDICGCPDVEIRPNVEICMRNVCQCKPGYWRRLSDCQCVPKDVCNQCVDYEYKPLDNS